MKQYYDVIRDRYDKLDFTTRGMLSNMYSLINPIGYYGAIHSIDNLSGYYANSLIRKILKFWMQVAEMDSVRESWQS